MVHPSGPTRHTLFGSIERTVVHPRGPTRYRDDDDNDDDDDDEDDEDDEDDDNDDDDVFIAIWAPGEAYPPPRPSGWTLVAPLDRLQGKLVTHLDRRGGRLSPPLFLSPTEHGSSACVSQRADEDTPRGSASSGAVQPDGSGAPSR